MSEVKTDKEIDEILRQAREGVSSEALCQRYGIDAVTLQRWQQAYADEQLIKSLKHEEDLSLTKAGLWVQRVCLCIALLVCVFFGFFVPYGSGWDYILSKFYDDVPLMVIIIGTSLLSFVAILFPRIYVGLLSLKCIAFIWGWWQAGNISVSILMVMIGMFILAALTCLNQFRAKWILVVFFLSNNLFLLSELPIEPYSERDDALIFLLGTLFFKYTTMPGGYVSVGFLISSLLPQKFARCKEAFTVFVYTYATSFIFLYFLLIFLYELDQAEMRRLYPGG